MFKYLSLIGLCLGSVWSQEHNTLTPEEEAAGWELLFDGTMNGPAGVQSVWTMYARDDESEPPVNSAWQVDGQNGEMYITGTSQDIRSKEKYGDFVFKFQYRTNGNQGVMYRTTLCDNWSWGSAVEISIDDDYVGPKIGPGDAYDLYSSRYQNFRSFNSSNPWNEFIVVAIGDSVEHWQNGQKLLSFRFWSDNFLQARSNSKWTSYSCYARPYTVGGRPERSGYVEEGYFALQGDHGGDFYLRNMKVSNNAVIGCMDSTRENYNQEATYDYRDVNEEERPDGAECGPVVDVVDRKYSAKNYIDVVQTAGELIITPEVPGRHEVIVRGVKGEEVYRANGELSSTHSIPDLQTGLYFVQFNVSGEEKFQRVAVY